MKHIPNFSQFKIVDLTHALSSEIPQWDEGCGFRQQIIADYEASSTTTKFRVQAIEMVAGIGTHMDAPLHCIPNGTDISQLSLENLIRPCVVVDVSAKANENYMVTPEDIIHFENNYGVISQNSFVIIRTGWDKFWEQPEQYRNHLNFPAVSEKTAELLLRRDIAGLGIDTLSPDNGDDFPVHQLLLSHNKYIIENIANAALLPAIGSYIFALPLKIQGGTESPVRLVGILFQS